MINIIIFSVLAEFNVPFERMRTIQKQINQLSSDLKRCMDECKEIYTKHLERLQRERDTALLAASQIDDPNNINAQLPPGVEISNKKVRNMKFELSETMNNFGYRSSVQIVIVMRWLSVLYADERHTALHFVSGKTG